MDFLFLPCPAPPISFFLVLCGVEFKLLNSPLCNSVPPHVTDSEPISQAPSNCILPFVQHARIENVSHTRYILYNRSLICMRSLNKLRGLKAEAKGRVHSSFSPLL